MKYLFSTSESDRAEIYKDELGNYWEKRYGLPKMPIHDEQAISIAWLEINRRGKGWPSVWDETENIRKITISPASQRVQCKMMLEMHITAEDHNATECVNHRLINAEGHRTHKALSA